VLLQRVSRGFNLNPLSTHFIIHSGLPFWPRGVQPLTPPPNPALCVTIQSHLFSCRHLWLKSPLKWTVFVMTGDTVVIEGARLRARGESTPIATLLREGETIVRRQCYNCWMHKCCQQWIICSNWNRGEEGRGVTNTRRTATGHTKHVLVSLADSRISSTIYNL